MRARVELTPGEKSAIGRLNSEEREAVIDQMLEHIREDLEWIMTVEHARTAAAAAPALARRAEQPPAPVAVSRFRWPTKAVRAR